MDDEDAFRLGLEISLNMSEEFAVKSCESAQSAIDLLKEQAFDVAIIDYQMPEISGLELLDWMRNEKIDTPVIMVTSHGSESLLTDAIKHGVYDYFRKDEVNLKKFSSIIKKVHNQHIHQIGKKLREEAELLIKVQTKEQEAFNAFQNTVNEIGQFIESSLTVHLMNLRRTEHALREMVDEQWREECTSLFNELRDEIETLNKGMKAMLDITILLTVKKVKEESEK